MFGILSNRVELLPNRRCHESQEMAARILEESVSLFGMIGELDQTKTIYTLISLIGVLLVFDTFLEMIEYFAEDAGYNGLLQKLYKEMMSKHFFFIELYLLVEL